MSVYAKFRTFYKLSIVQTDPTLFLLMLFFKECYFCILLPLCKILIGRFESHTFSVLGKNKWLSVFGDTMELRQSKQSPFHCWPIKCFLQEFIWKLISFASRGVLSRGTRAWTLDRTIAMTGHCPQIVLFPFAPRSVFSSLHVIYIFFFIFHSLKAGLKQANVPAVCSPQPAVLMCARLEELGVGFGEGVRVKWPHWGRFISLPHPLP